MKKKIVYSIAIVLGICMTGCGKNSVNENFHEKAEIINEDTSNDDAKDTNGSEKKEEIVEAGENIDFEEDEVGEDWKQAYIPIVKQWNIMHSNDYSYGYELIYIDDNDVPECCCLCRYRRISVHIRDRYYHYIFLKFQIYPLLIHIHNKLFL